MQTIVHQLRLFFIAVQFFTRIPIPAWVGFESSWLQASVRYFPWVGLVVGAVVALVYYLFAQILPQTPAVLLSTIAGVYLTGAFHEDGFADMCDGFGGGYTVQRVLEIMQDSRVGAYGAIGIALMLALKCSALANLPPKWVVASLLLAHSASRLAATSIILCMDYAKDQGKAKPLAQQISKAEYVMACLPVFALLACFTYFGYLPWIAMLLALACAAVATAWMGWKMQRRIGGFTGDCLGATQQVAEAVMYLALLAGVARPALV
ncbi:MAG: adenosylcobinamide-GDP ribazoletransferase [Burkholderiales bacterium]|nr:adenosylcobinamide-GDP ribazoletransferase [Burkholderiales bacterium]